MVTDGYRRHIDRHSDVYIAFRKHPFAGGQIKGVLLLFLFNFSAIKSAYKLPLVGNVLRSVQSLYIGYCVELENSLQGEFLNYEEDARLTVTNLDYDRILDHKIIAFRDFDNSYFATPIG